MNLKWSYCHDHRLIEVSFILTAGDSTDVQTKSLNTDLLANVKIAWDGLMS